MTCQPALRYLRDPVTVDRETLLGIYGNGHIQGMNGQLWCVAEQFVIFGFWTVNLIKVKDYYKIRSKIREYT